MAEEPVAAPSTTPAPETVPEQTGDSFHNAMVGDLDKQTFDIEPDESGEAEESAAAEQEATPDTDTETAKPADTETATAATLDSLMGELNLKGKYKTPEEVLKAHVHLNQELETQRREASQSRELLMQALREKVTEKPSTDESESLTDEEREQVEWFKKMAKNLGFVQKADIEPLEQGVASATGQALIENGARAIEELDGLTDVAKHFRRTGNFPPMGENVRWDAMMQAFQKRPSMRSMNLPECVEVLYALTASADSKPPAPGVSKGKKTSAQTTTSARAGEMAGAVPDMQGWSLDQMRTWMEEHGLA